MINLSAYLFPNVFLVLLSIVAIISSLYFFVQLNRCRRRLKDKERESMEREKFLVLANLSAGILHRISQPITAIYGFARFMKKEIKPGDPFYTPVSLLEEQSQSLKEMLDDLRELSQSRQAIKENVSVNEIIEKSMRLVTDELRIRRIEFNVRLQENLPPVYADGLKLQHLFINLIVKAMERLSALRPLACPPLACPPGQAGQAGQAGQIKSFQITSSFNERTRELEIFFKDSGPEITDQERGPIFELINELNGTLSLENDSSGGTQFVVRLPSSKEILQDNNF